MPRHRLYSEAAALAESGDYKAAEKVLLDYLAAGGDASQAKRLAAKLDKAVRDPYQSTSTKSARISWPPI